MATARALGEELKQLRDEQAAAFKSARKEDGSLELAPEDAEKISNRNQAIEEKAAAYKKALELEEMAESNDGELKRLSTRGVRQTSDGDPGAPAGEGVRRIKTLGQLVVESEEAKNRLRGQGFGLELDIEKHFGKSAAAQGIKALIDLSAAPPAEVRLPTIVTPGEQQPTVASLMPQGTSNAGSIKYLEETTTTPGAFETDESGTKPEAALAFTERTAEFRKIAVTVPVTDESLEDNDFLESYINNRLRAFVLMREDSQLINGSGTGTPTELAGILSFGIGSASGGNNNADAIMAGIVDVAVASYLPATGVVMHPADWADLRLLREDQGGGTGTYLMGPPSQSGPQTIWGLDVVTTTAMTQGTALVGNFRLGAQVWRKGQIRVDVGYVDKQFINNQRTIRVEERLALTVYRPSAFSEVTLAS
jgi:HK97 family phage major capsid protein